MNTNTVKSTLVRSCAVFALFFGSGNLVFPLVLGQQAAGALLSATAGLAVTAILVPLLGLLAMSLFKASTKAFFAPLGKVLTWLICAASLALMGPCGVAPRCALVAHGATSLLAPQMPVWAFSLAFCAVIALLLVNRSRMVEYVGKWLTPALLVGIAAIFAVAFYHGAPAGMTDSGLSASEAFFLGLRQGYQTMDLLAALFFAGLILAHVNREFSSEKASMHALVTSSALGMALMLVIYAGMVYLGAAHADLLTQTMPDRYFVAIAQHHLGKWAAPAVAVVFVLACLTTAVALVELFSEFLRTQAGLRLPRWLSLGVTLAAMWTLSLVGFSALMGFLGSVLELLYPALIALTLAQLAAALPRHQLVRASFWLTLGSCVLGAYCL